MVENATVDGFLIDWPEFGPKMTKVLECYDKSFTSKWNSEVNTILMLLKTLPFSHCHKKTKRNAAKNRVLSYADAIERIIVFEKVS